jgi:hypothetical protein
MGFEQQVFFPISCGQTKVGHLFYFLVKFGSRLLEISKLKEPLFPIFFMFKIKYPHVLSF